LGLSGALLSVALSGDPAVGSVRAHAAQAARPAQLRGAHQVSAEVGASGAQLLLKDGFSLRVRVRAPQAPARVSLAVAEQRAQAAQVAPGFVPIGPTVRALGEHVGAEVAYRAEAFRVREGHRLVLAVETRPACAAGETCWELVAARYAGSQCLANPVALQGLRLQFGSVPINAPARSVHSAAP
jgi:hypothetical protein